MPIEGTLKELNLPSIIQLNCAERNTATVSVSYQGQGGYICFSDGSIVHAAVGDLVGDEAVYELLRWPDGSFIVEADEIPADRTITTSWNELLLEGIRRVDEDTALVDCRATIQWDGRDGKSGQRTQEDSRRGGVSPHLARWHRSRK